MGDTAAPYECLGICVFRAIENGISIVRSANTGISSFIDPNGRIIGKITDNGRETFIEGYLTEEVPLMTNKTFYANYGDVFAMANIIATLLIIVLRSLRHGRKKGEV